jgi:hypothetical protein
MLKMPDFTNPILPVLFLCLLVSAPGKAQTFKDKEYFEYVEKLY